MTPAVSVIMPVRNGDAWLGQSIESMMARDFADFELLIVYDGSADGTPFILDEFSRRDRQGYADGARNNALSHIKLNLARLYAHEAAYEARKPAQNDHPFRRFSRHRIKPP